MRVWYCFWWWCRLPAPHLRKKFGDCCMEIMTKLSGNFGGFDGSEDRINILNSSFSIG